MPGRLAQRRQGGKAAERQGSLAHLQGDQPADVFALLTHAGPQMAMDRSARGQGELGWLGEIGGVGREPGGVEAKDGTIRQLERRLEAGVDPGTDPGPEHQAKPAGLRVAFDRERRCGGRPAGEETAQGGPDQPLHFSASSIRIRASQRSYSASFRWNSPASSKRMLPCLSISTKLGQYMMS